MGWDLRPVWRFALLCVLLAGVSGVLAADAGAAPAADYGDAPDGARAGYLSKPHVIGHFPSKLRSNGAHHAGPGLIRLGETFDAEGDSKQVNKDEDDDGVSVEAKPCKKGTVSFIVNALNLPDNLRNSSHTAYLNAWFDWNQDGRWKGDSRCGGKSIPEWRIKNFRVRLTTFADDPVQIIRVPMDAGPQVGDIWIRGSITLDQKFTSPLAKGAFSEGETEDYLYHGEQPPPPSKKKKKKKGAGEEPRRLIPYCFPGFDFIDHGKAATFAIFFQDPATGALAFPEPGTAADPLNGNLAPPLPPDVTFQQGVLGSPFGGTLTSTAIDDRDNPFELAVEEFRVHGPLIDPSDELVSCPLVIVHSHHGKNGGGGTTPQGPDDSQQGGGGQQPGGGGTPQPVGQPPVAAFTFTPNNPPSGPKVGQYVTFAGSSSSDPDGKIVSWDWDFGNGQHQSGEFGATSYSAPGIYTASLTVTDNDGNKNTTTKQVYVSGPGSKPAVLSDVPCDAIGGTVDINIPSYAQNADASLTSALTGCPGLTITNVRVTFVPGPVPPENGGSTTDEWGQPKNHLHIDYDLSGASNAAGPGSATFTATWQ